MTREHWDRIEQLYHQALEHRPDERASFLVCVCAGDDLLRREVESLLAYDDSAEWFMREVPADLVAEALDTQASRIVIGRRIGPYEVLSPLGRGGMGAVFLALDTRLGRKVAVKILRQMFTHDREQVRRFRQEAQSASALNHPNIVTVFEIVEVDKLHLIATEFIDGQTLEGRITTGPVGVREVLEIAIQIARALIAAHAAGIVHRDIKPANVMLRRDGYVKVLDFGIAKLISSDHDDVQTRSGMVIGTPRYMSPEQILRQELDGRSDIFSFGVLLCELLTGQAPFSGSVADEFLRGDHVPIPSLAFLEQGIRPEVERIIHKTLVIDRDDRYQSALELLNDLTKLKTELDVSDAVSLADRRDRSVAVATNRPRRMSRARTWFVGVAASAVIMAAAGLFIVARIRTEHEAAAQRSSIVVLPFSDLSAEKNQGYIAEGLPEELRNWLARIPQLQVMGTTSSRVFRDHPEDFRIISKKLKVKSILEGSVRKQGERARIAVRLIRASDGFQMWSESFDRDTKDVLTVEEDVARAVARELNITLEAFSTRSRSPEAFAVYLLGRHSLSRNKQMLENAAGLFEQSTRLDPRFGPAWEGLGEVRMSQAESGYLPIKKGFDEARDALQHALRLDPNMPQANWYMGMINLRYEWDWNAADTFFRRALEKAPGHSRGPRGLARLAWTLGRGDEAVALYRRAIELDPLNAALHYDLGVILHYTGHQQDAQNAIRSALDLSPKMEGAHWVLCRIALSESRLEDALSESQQETNAAFRLHGLGLVNYALGRRSEADANFAELIKSFQSDAPFQIAELFSFRGEKDKAFEWLDRAYSTHDTGLTEIKGDPLMTNLVHDSRYEALFESCVCRFNASARRGHPTRTRGTRRSRYR